MMALSLVGEVISANVIDVRALPHIADWAAALFGVSIGIAIGGAVTTLWEMFHAR